MSAVLDKLHALQALIQVKPGPIAHIKALYRFALRDTEDVYDVNLAEGVVEIGQVGAFSIDPVCTINLSENDMLKLLNHELNTTIAYMMGQIKIEGKLGSALKLLEALSEYK